MAQFFPSEPTPAPPTSVPELTDEELDGRTKKALREAFIIESASETGPEHPQSGLEKPIYTTYKTMHSVPTIMESFFTVVGESNISTSFW